MFEEQKAGECAGRTATLMVGRGRAAAGYTVFLADFIDG
jgi:hypothetical protein